MDIGEVLHRAWEIIWKNKALWLFGILASCSNGGGGGGGNTSYQFSEGDIDQEFSYTFGRLDDWEIALITGAIILFVLIMVVLVTYLSTIGRIGLIQGTVEAEAGGSRLGITEIFNLSTPFFWRVFFLNLLIGLAIAAVVIVGLILGFVFSVATIGLGLICLIPLLCLLVPLSWLVNVVIEQANIALVVEDLGILDALRRGWDVFRENLGTMIVMGLVLVIGAAIVSLLIAAPLVGLAFPIFTGLIIGSDAAIGGGFIISVLCLFGLLFGLGGNAVELSCLLELLLIARILLEFTLDTMLAINNFLGPVAHDRLLCGPLVLELNQCLRGSGYVVFQSCIGTASFLKQCQRTLIGRLQFTRKCFTG